MRVCERALWASLASLYFVYADAQQWGFRLADPNCKRDHYRFWYDKKVTDTKDNEYLRGWHNDHNTALASAYLRSVCLGVPHIILFRCKPGDTEYLAGYGDSESSFVWQIQNDVQCEEKPCEKEETNAIWQSRKKETYGHNSTRNGARRSTGV